MVKIVSIKYPRGIRNSGLPAAIPGAKYKETIYNYHIAITIKLDNYSSNFNKTT